MNDRRDSHDGGPGGIQAVSRVCRMLDLLTSQRELHATDVAEQLGLERTTAHRYLSSLIATGYLKRDSDGRYVAGPSLMQLAIATFGPTSPVAVAGPYMQRLAEQARQSVVLSLWGGDSPVVSRVEEDSSRLVHVSVRVGSSLPYDAAQSQVFLAFLPNREKVRQLLYKLPRRASRDLETQIQHVQDQGYGINSVVVEGIRAVAAPVFGRGGAIEATLAVVGTVHSISVQRESPVIQELLHTAEQLSQQLGYSPSHEQAVEGIA